ncbi:MAG: DNA-processing protein DprA, partial [Gammaproteobacteria bacterium]
MNPPESEPPACADELGPEELRFWFALWRTPGVGSATFRRLLDRFGSPREVFASSAASLQHAGLGSIACSYLRDPDWSGADRDIQWLEAPRHHVVLEYSPSYPALLKEIQNPPPILFVNGNPNLLGRHQLAMIGSRNPTPVGSRTALEFAHYFGSAGLLITSGLATGIDTACHHGALQGGGSTIAVMGTGPDQTYPASNQELAEEIAAVGALVSEFPVGTGPRPEHFPQRNRIISGLSLGTLVVEAASRSGSLITAYHALEQGREVFAIPGSIHNPLTRGCHGLIHQGAKLVETAADVLEELGSLAGTIAEPKPAGKQECLPPLDGEYAQLLDCIGFEPTAIDQLVEFSGLTPEAVSSMLLILELQGYVASSPGGLYSRIEKE